MPEEAKLIVAKMTKEEKEYYLFVQSQAKKMAEKIVKKMNKILRKEE